MTNLQHKTAVAFVPATIGILLWGAATALLLEEAYHAQRFDVATMSVPILTAATVAAAVLAHQRFARWRLIGGTGFALLALLGSLVMATGTLGRIAEAKDSKASTVQAVNRTYGNKADDLKAAKAEQAKECRSIGKKCEAWNARVDKLTSELSGIVVKATDPKADAIARLATLIGGDGDTVREIVAATDPVTLPLFLEFGSVLFFAAAFGHRRVAIVHTPTTIAADPITIAPQPFTKAQALHDLQRMREAGSGRLLASRWHVDPATVSRWLSDFEASGAIQRTREGKSKAISLVPVTRRLANRSVSDSQ